MSNFDNKMIQEAAYYIWKNNGCPNNTSASDWQAAIDQLLEDVITVEPNMERGENKDGNQGNYFWQKKYP